MEIREAIDILGEWKGEGKVGRTKIDRFVSILNADLDDPRLQDQVSYPLTEILVLSFFAMLGGSETFEEIDLFYECKPKYFSRFLSLKAEMPSQDIFNRVFSLIDMEEFREALIAFITEGLGDLRKARHIPKPKKTPLDVDDKKAKHSDAVLSLEHTLQTLHVQASHNGICLKPFQIEKDSNTISTVQAVLTTMDLRKTMVVFNAMESQCESIAFIIAKRGHYLGRIGEDQKTLLKECASYFKSDYLKKTESDPNLYAMLMKKNQEHMDECICTVAKVKIGDDSPFSHWPGMKAVVCFDTRTENSNTGEKTNETEYYITSLDNSAQVCMKAVREHWYDEDPVYSVKEIVFYDDEETIIANKRANDNLALMKRMTRSIYKMVKPLEGIKALSSIKKGFFWGYEEILDTMLQSCDSKTIREALESSLTKKKS